MRPTEYNAAEPWRRQPFDGDRDWALFADFLAMPSVKRSVRRVAERAGASWTWLETVAWENAWTTRAGMWDAHLDALRTTTIEHETQEDARAVARRHLRGTGKAWKFLERELDRYLSAYEEGDMPIMTPRDAIRWLALIVRSERLVLGDATEIKAKTVDLSGWSLDDLRRARELQEKAKAA